MKRNALNKFLLAALCSSIAAGLAGCGNTPKKTVEAAEEISNEPVTLKILFYQPLSDEEFHTLLVEPLKKKHPNITLEKMSSSVENAVSTGNIPDLLVHWNGGAGLFMQLGILGDITDLVKKHKVDLNRFEPATLDTIKAIAGGAELYGLPYSMQFNALYYNKDLFNKFGVSYPKDGMTWDDAIELGKKLTRKEGDVQYRGLSYEYIHRLAFPLSPDYVDGKTDRANVNNELWKKVFELGNRINSIPGNTPTTSHDDFIKKQNVAMYGSINLFYALKDAVKNGFNLGIAQYPSFKEQPNVFGMVDAHYMFISKQSKHRDAAMQVLTTLTSDEVQIDSARKFVRSSPLKNPETKKQFGAETDYLKDVSLQSIFKSKPATAPALSKYNKDAGNIVLKKFEEYNRGAKDLNTALREADEEINKKIAELK